MSALLWIVIFIAVLVALAFYRSRLNIAMGVTAAVLVAWSLTAGASGAAVAVAWLLYAVVFLPFRITRLRQAWLTGPALRWFRRALPELSADERTALQAGTVSWEAELFSGLPDWRQLQRLPPAQLSAAEQAFIAGPLQAVLTNLVAQQRTATTTATTVSPQPLSAAIWQQLKAAGFFGLAIPTRFGGLGFSAYGRSTILAQIASAPGGATLGPIVAAAGGLGPAQLLLACGTPAQQQQHLPDLARGAALPCFAVTSERAGTDITAVNAYGTVCAYEVDGERQIGLRLNWDKRYITLAPVATLIGLAIRIRDPQQLLGHNTDPGLTCVLVDAQTPGVSASRQHAPVGAAFPYGTTRGRDVLVPLDAVIGGADMIGRGWELLLEQLPVSRALAKPAAAAGVCAGQARITGAYARVRRQFGRPIGAFEGVEEILARTAGHAYACEAVRRLLCNSLDLGARPATAAAIAKYHSTSRAQQVVVDCMTLLAGKATCAGPRNPTAGAYAAAPLAATADGTNVFTRSTLILGQGSIRCHPFLQAEIAATQRPDEQQALTAFDAVLPRHIGHVLSMAARAVVLGITAGRGSAGGDCARSARYQQRINRYAAALALVTDLSMAILGDNLRHREYVSGRLGDVLSQLYIASAVLQRFRADGAHPTDSNVVEWVCEDCFAICEQQLARVLRHLPKPTLTWPVRLLIFPLGRHADGPGDDCSHRVASVLQMPGDTRQRLTAPSHAATDSSQGMGLFDAAMQATTDTSGLRTRLRRAFQRGQLAAQTPIDAAVEARDLGLLDASEFEQLQRWQSLHDAVVAVDTFATDVHAPQNC